MDINAILIIGLFSIPLAIFTLFLGLVRLLIFTFSNQKTNYPRNFVLGNVCLFAPYAFIGFKLSDSYSAGVGSTSGLFLPLFAPVLAISSILYYVLAFNTKAKISKRNK